MKIYHYTSTDDSQFLIETDEDIVEYDYILAICVYEYNKSSLISNKGYFDCSRIRLPNKKELSDYNKIQVFK